MISKLEDLPNEIITNIMECISSPIDVHRAFSGLNQRIEILLLYVHLSIDIFWEDQQSLTFTHHFATHCNRLRVFNVCPTITLIRFPRLRSLTMTQPTDAQINSIRSTALPMLEYLASPATLIIFDCLFGKDQQRWRFLRSCNFFFTHIPTPNVTWKFNENLCILSGITCSRIILSQLVKLVPRLKYLRVDMISNDRSNWIMPVTVENLVSLRISFSRLVYEDLAVLIGPYLSRLYLEVYEEHIFINFAHLGALLMSIPQKVKRFNCDYRGHTVNINAIRATHFLFRNMQLVPSFSNDIIKLFSKNMDPLNSDIISTIF